MTWRRMERRKGNWEAQSWGNGDVRIASLGDGGCVRTGPSPSLESIFHVVCLAVFPSDDLSIN